MGGNGSYASGKTATELGRDYKTIDTIGDIEILQLKNPKSGIKLPEESHEPNRTYAIFDKNGNLKEIAVYGPDCKKEYEIHFKSHDGINPHYHKWEDGHPEWENDHSKDKRAIARPLTKEMRELVDKIENYKQD